MSFSLFPSHSQVHFVPTTSNQTAKYFVFFWVKISWSRCRLIVWGSVMNQVRHNWLVQLQSAHPPPPQECPVLCWPYTHYTWCVYYIQTCFCQGVEGSQTFPFNHPRLCFSLGSSHLGHQRWAFSLRIRPYDLVWLIYGVCFTSPEINSGLVGRLSVDVYEGCLYDDRNTTALAIFLSSFRHWINSNLLTSIGCLGMMWNSIVGCIT